MAGATSASLAVAEPTICTWHTVSPAYFSPNRDRFIDTTRISFRLAQAAHVELNILNSSGTRVRRLVDGNRAASSSAYGATFNGADGAGRQLPNGSYRYQLVCANASGTQILYRPLVIDRNPPYLGTVARTPSIFWPNGDGFRDEVFVRYGANELALAGMRVRTATGRNVRFYSYTWQQPGRHAFTWNGKNGSGARQPYGRYKLYLSVRDRAGNRTSRVWGVYIAPFSDIFAEGTFRSSILALVNHRVLTPYGHGWFTGRSDGSYGNRASMRRGDLAVAVVKTQGWQNESPAGVTFSDIPNTSPLYKYAAVAVKHGVMGYTNAQTKAFSPRSSATAGASMVAMVRGMGLGSLAENIKAQDRNAPSYAPYAVIGGNLAFRYDYTLIWPRRAYNRREFAFSLNRRIHVESWRIQKMRALFGAAAAKPITQSSRQKAITHRARQLIGYPYVWGGDSYDEGGFDCSGFVWQILRNELGYRIQRTSYDAAADSRYPRIGRIRNLKPGDTVYFVSPSQGRIGHTGIYLGNRYFIHSTRGRGGVNINRFDSTYDSYWVEQFGWGRRIIPVVRLSGVSLSSGTIRPGGSPTYTRMSYRISKTSLIMPRVYRGSTLVRAVKAFWHRTGSGSVVWNGRNNSGALVGAGRYTMKLVVRDAEGNYASAVRGVTVVR